MRIIEQLADLVVRIPEVKVSLDGHVCSAPEYGGWTKMSLSAGRAETVRRELLCYLPQNFHKSVVARGHGNTRPAYGVNAMNRRVEVCLLLPDGKACPPRTRYRATGRHPPPVNTGLFDRFPADGRRSPGRAMKGNVTGWTSISDR